MGLALKLRLKLLAALWHWGNNLWKEHIPSLPPPPPQDNSASFADAVTRLRELHCSGILNDEEFAVNVKRLKVQYGIRLNEIGS